MALEFIMADTKGDKKVLCCVWCPLMCVNTLDALFFSFPFSCFLCLKPIKTVIHHTMLCRVEPNSLIIPAYHLKRIIVELGVAYISSSWAVELAVLTLINVFYACTRERSSLWSTSCADSYFGIRSIPCYRAVACKRTWSFCQRCRWQVTAKHTCTVP